MKKHVFTFSESINESLGKGSVILIKGKPDSDGRRMLYAAHVDGFAEFHPGAVMLFLSHVFYRIKLVDGHLRALQIDYKNEKSLKAVLNLKTAGRISVVRNSNKTPLHWKTTKHVNVSSALREIESDLLNDNYIVESSNAKSSVDEIQFKNILYKHILSLLFYGKNKISTYVKHIEGTNIETDDWIENIDSEPVGRRGGGNGRGSGEADWELSYDMLIVGLANLTDSFKRFKLSRNLYFTITFKSEFSINTWYDPGDRETPPDSGWEFSKLSTNIDHLTLISDDSDFDLSEKDYDSELTSLISGINKDISESEAYDITSLIKKNIGTFYKSF